MRCCHVITLTTLFCASTVSFGQSRQDNWKQCTSSDPDQSIAGCSSLIQSGQESPANLSKAFDSRGLAYMHKRDYDRAIQDYDQAVRLSPYFANPIYNRALAYRLKGDYGRAISDYDQALQLTPTDADSFYGRGLAYAHEGNYDRAIQDYSQALRINPGMAYVFHLRGIAYAHKGAYLKAIVDYGRWRGILGLTTLCLFWVALVFAVGEMLRKGGDQNVRPRRCMGWIFAAEACKYLEDALRGILNIIHQHVGISASTLAFSLLVAFVSGLAWWTVWRNKSSAKGCAVAASLIQVVIFVRQFIPPLRPVGDYHAVPLIVGVGGLLIFLGRDRRHPGQPLADEKQSHLISLFEGEPADANSRNYS